jgi:hypothetical protein
MFSYLRLRRFQNNTPSTTGGLPPEILSHIISFASDQCTLRSLSLVSRTTSALTLPFLYRFVTISGTTQLVAFLEVVQRIPARRAYIRSIFLCDATPEKRGTSSYCDVLGNSWKAIFEDGSTETSQAGRSPCASSKPFYSLWRHYYYSSHRF